MKTQEEYNAMTEYELFDSMQTADQYEMRKIHKALKKFGDGVPLMYRYPDFPFYFSLATMIVVAIGSVLKVLL